MASNYTENYGLCQWEATDQVLRTDFNEDNAKIEAALVKHDTAMAENAQAIQTETNARTSGDLAEEQARTSAVASLTAELAKRGNCQLYISSYRGTGENGTTISQTFPKKPLAVIVTGAEGGLMVMLQGLGQATHFRTANYSYMNNITWSGTKVSWRSTQSAGGDPQMNASGVTYKVLALLDATS